jgi:hypothetical protein
VSAGFPPLVTAVIDERSMGWCEVCGEHRVQERHHRRPRGMGGSRRDDTNVASNGLGLCSGCHRLIESYRTVAELLGWLVPQGTDPSNRRVIYRGQPALLADDGGIEYLEVAA